MKLVKYVLDSPLDSDPDAARIERWLRDLAELRETYASNVEAVATIDDEIARATEMLAGAEPHRGHRGRAGATR